MTESTCGRIYKLSGDYDVSSDGQRSVIPKFNPESSDSPRARGTELVSAIETALRWREVTADHAALIHGGLPGPVFDPFRFSSRYPRFKALTV
jgi:hypothetical protein